MDAKSVDKMTFLKYNSSVVRHKIKTDFYTEQTIEAIKYNVENLIKNTKETFKEVTNFDN